MASKREAPPHAHHLTVNHIFDFMTVAYGEKCTFDREPFAGKRTIVSSIGSKESISHCDNSRAAFTTSKVYDRMIGFLKDIKERLPHSSVRMNDRDMREFDALFEEDANRHNEGDGTAEEDRGNADIAKEAADSLAIGLLQYGLISFSDDDIMFYLHPNKAEWVSKGQDMYGDNCARVLETAFHLRCTSPDCAYTNIYYPHVRCDRGAEPTVEEPAGGGPVVLPIFIRDGLMDLREDFVEEVATFNNYVSENPHLFPLMCLPCLMGKQMRNAFNARISPSSSTEGYPQLQYFTIVDLLENTTEWKRRTPTENRFMQTFIHNCEEVQKSSSRYDLYEAWSGSLYTLPRLPFEDIEIVSDDASLSRYNVRWKEGVREKCENESAIIRPRKRKATGVRTVQTVNESDIE